MSVKSDGGAQEREDKPRDSIDAVAPAARAVEDREDALLGTYDELGSTKYTCVRLETDPG